VEDHCRGIAAILESGVPGEVYNIGGRSECENLRLVRMLCEIADESFREQPELCAQYPECPAARGQSTSALISFVKDRPGHDRRYAINCDKIERELGFSPARSLADGLRATFSWYVQNATWWRAVMDGEYRHWIERQYGRDVPGNA
jgi:dTDP-glucose 4,6-dehydratase